MTETPKLVDVRDSHGRVFSLTSAAQTSTRKFFLSILRSPAYWEPRLARAFVKSMRTLRDRFDRPALERALRAKNKRAALECVPDDASIRDALVPVAAILRDAVMAGGKLAEAEINRGK